MRRRLLTEDRGAAALEFALVAPLLLFLVFALIYGLFAVAAHVSLAHAASVGARYAALPIDPVTNVYPTLDEVAARVDQNTPFFSTDTCETALSGASADNAPLTLDVDCEFPNPMGGAISALQGVFTANAGADTYASTLEISAHAEARRE